MLSTGKGMLPGRQILRQPMCVLQMKSAASVLASEKVDTDLHRDRSLATFFLEGVQRQGFASSCGALRSQI
jgi:hypothetical protein